MTNYEKIKAMSVEEMANEMRYHIECCACPAFRDCHSIFSERCPKCLEKWLLQEAEK